MAFVHVREQPAKILTVFQPAGDIESFFRDYGKLTATPEQARQFYKSHGMDVRGSLLPASAGTEREIRRYSDSLARPSSRLEPCRPRLPRISRSSAIAHSLTLRQYSSGSNSVVKARSASVITHSFWPEAVA
jgi:hypothetical protein